MKVYNKNKEKFEAAEKAVCPRCRGFGAIFPGDSDKDHCFLCRGWGKVVQACSGSGWLRALHQKPVNSTLW